MGIACHLWSDKIGLFIRFVFTMKLHLGHHKASIGPMKLIYLKGVGTTFHQPAMLVNHATLAQGHQVDGLIQTNLFLKLVAG